MSAINCPAIRRSARIAALNAAKGIDANKNTLESSIRLRVLRKVKNDILHRYMELFRMVIGICSELDRTHCPKSWEWKTAYESNKKVQEYQGVWRQLTKVSEEIESLSK